MDKRIAHPDEEDQVRRTVAWNHRWDQEYAGFFYDEELAGPNGMDVQILVTEDTTDEKILEAEHEARETQDVVGFGALVVPAEWLEVEGTPAAPKVKTLRSIVDDHTAQPLRWSNGEKQVVDPTTADLLLKVIGSLKEPTRDKVIALISRSKADFLSVLDIAWRSVK